MKFEQRKMNLAGFGMLVMMATVLGYVVGVYRTEYRLKPYLWRGNSELQALATRYGATRNSRYGEEWIVRDFFEDRRGGVFVDVGANHYQRDSNTYYLERELGWSGLAIEPQTKFAADYRARRPLTTFVPLFVSDVSDRKQTMTLDDILERHGIGEVDFLSIDIELHEPQALKGFSIDRFRPRLVGVESHAPVRQQILDYFANRGYVVIGKYLRADSENLWFAPIGQAGSGTLETVAHSH